jgi:hypothetical protein
MVVKIDARVFIGALTQIKNVGKSKYVEVEVLSDGIRLNVKLNEVGGAYKVNKFRDVFDVQCLIDALKPVEDTMVELHCYSDDKRGNCINIIANDGKYQAAVMGVRLD